MSSSTHLRKVNGEIKNGLEEALKLLKKVIQVRLVSKKIINKNITDIGEHFEQTNGMIERFDEVVNFERKKFEENLAGELRKQFSRNRINRKALEQLLGMLHEPPQK